MTPPAITTTAWLILTPLVLLGLGAIVVGYLRLRAGDEDRAGRWRWWLTLAVLVLLPLALFALLAEDVATDEGIRWDVSIMRWALDHHSGAAASILRLVTMTGNAVTVIAALSVVSIVLVRAGRRRQAVFLVTATIAAMIVNPLVKQVFQRARPDLIPHHPIGGYAFPSGHTMNSMSFAAALVVAFWHTRQRWLVATAAPAWAVVVALSRVYLGVHYPSDVVAGWALAVAVVGIVWLLFWRDLEAGHKRERRQGPVGPTQKGQA